MLSLVNILVLAFIPHVLAKVTYCKSTINQMK